MEFTELEIPVRRAITEMHTKKAELENAFRTSVFVYGTQGSNVIGNVLKTFAQRAVDADTGQARDSKRLLNIFDPGFRAAAYVHGLNTQMMDLYYGAYKNESHKDRNVYIGEFVHRAMSFSGSYSQDVPGYEAYWNTFGRVPSPSAGKDWHPSPYWEGWETPAVPGPHPRKRYGEWFYPNPDADDPNAGMKASMYMSRVIRTGVMYFGGTLILDGAEIYYESVFSTRNVRDSDTAMEARALFPFFVCDPNKSQVAFGNGKLIFHWFGKETVPTRALFKENWFWCGGPMHREANHLDRLHAHDFSTGKPVCGAPVVEKFSPLWNGFPASHPSNTAVLREARNAAAAKWAEEQQALHELRVATKYARHPEREESVRARLKWARALKLISKKKKR